MKKPARPRMLPIRAVIWLAGRVIGIFIVGIAGLLCVFGLLAVLTLAGLWPLPKPSYEGYSMYAVTGYAVTGVMMLVMTVSGLYAESRVMRRLRARWPWLT